ncbi:MAG: YSC84-related protein [Pseudomonadota bacterium]
MTRRLALVGLAVLLAACMTPRGTPDQQRTAIRDMRDDVLQKLYAEKSSARSEIANAPGYGVFSNANVNLILASFAGGYGLIRDQTSGKETFMKMGEVGIGLGAGVKDYRVIFVFHDKDTLNDFVEKGWSFGGQADAAAKASDQGAAAGAEAILDGVTVYQMTESGLALQATVKGTKYWKDDELN